MYIHTHVTTNTHYYTTYIQMRIYENKTQKVSSSSTNHVSFFFFGLVVHRSTALYNEATGKYRLCQKLI